MIGNLDSAYPDNSRTPCKEIAFAAKSKKSSKNMAKPGERKKFMLDSFAKKPLLQNFLIGLKKIGAKFLTIITQVFSKSSLLMIGLYRAFMSGHIGGVCRFHPTCSVYAEQAFKEKHPLKASCLVLRRLCRCRPFGAYGYDPIPQESSQ